MEEKEASSKKTEETKSVWSGVRPGIGNTAVKRSQPK
jgi:hypothetical protein